MANQMKSVSAPGSVASPLRWLAGLAALFVGATAVWFAARYPILPTLVLGLWVAWVVVCYRSPLLWVGVVPALLPVLGFAPWTGWLVVEELDFLLAGVVFAGFGRIALAVGAAGTGHHASGPGNGTRIPLFSLVLLIALVGTSSIAAVRGVLDAAPTDAGFTQGYFDPLNSLRLLKPFFWALLVAPLFVANLRAAPARTAAHLVIGLATGLGVAAMGALWERAAFPDVLNFSADYRTTSLFWEMHVGGAALDGYLALAFPFALALALDVRGRTAHLATSLLVLLACYAALTTFSRGVYAALPVGVLVFLVLRIRQDPRFAAARGWRAAIGAAAFLLAGSGIAWAIFQHGGYRGLLAMLMAFAALVVSLPAMRSLPARLLALALVSGLIASAAVAVVGTVLPKGPYVCHAVLFAMWASLAYMRKGSTEPGVVFAATATALALVASAVNVSLHWGGTPGAVLPALAGIAVLLAAVWASRSAVATALTGWREQLWLVAAAAMLGAGVSVLVGGAYLGERFATTREDLDGRMKHWSASLDVLAWPADWVFGKGLGRYPASYFYHVPDTGLPGSYAWKQIDGNGYLSLSGPRYSMSWGDLFRFAQRVPPEHGNYSLSFDLRAATDIEVHAEICEKHLLYNENCAVASRLVKAAGPGWHRAQIELDGQKLSGGAWYAPRLAFFSLAVASSGRNAEFDNLRLVGPDGADVIANGAFDEGTARWFFTSDRHHLPWHIKNLFLNVLFEQGAAGLMVFGALLIAFFWRVCLGSAKAHPLAPSLAGAVAGFVVVGLFDSLLDVPRVAWQFYMLLCIGLLVVPGGGRSLARSEGH
jgi:hypothetical protein